MRETSELLVRRGAALYENGDAGGALSTFAEARRLLEGERSDGADPDLDGRLFGVLQNEGLVYADLGSIEEALEAFAGARALAPTRRDLRDVLFQEELLLRGRDAERRMAVFAELDFHALLVNAGTGDTGF